MKPIILNRVLFMVLAVCSFSAGTVHAHGTGFRMLPGSDAIAVHFFYTGGEPMAFAQINIQGPDPDQPEYQNGRTDCKGAFAFCPDRPGTWNLTVNDGRGHGVHASIEVADNIKRAGANAVQAKGAQSPGWVAVLAGLSLLLNIALISIVLKARK